MTPPAVHDVTACLSGSQWLRAPWPHMIVEPFTPDQVADARREVELLPPTAFTWQHTPRIHKGTLSDISGLGPSVTAMWDALVGAAFVAELRRVTGLEDLEAGEDGMFAGVFITPAGGWQRVHEDFPRHPVTGRWHRAVALLYLSDWEPGTGGELELWRRPMRGQPTLVEPRAGRMVLFQPTAETLHGIRQVRPNTAPRVALAVRYYSSVPPEPVPHHALRRTVRRPDERFWQVRPGLQELVDYARGTGLASRRRRVTR